MIRRNANAQWVLISQIEHARLAADLARHWGGPPFAPVLPEMLLAIAYHDEGWAEWERTPLPDVQTGRPLQFIEMPLADALDIWRRSIDHCEIFGPLSAWTVAGHFSALLRGSAHAGEPLAVDWLADFDERRVTWLAEWMAIDAVQNTRSAAEFALRELQMFDALSLWFCCAERTQPHTLRVPDGMELTLTPRSPTEIELAPWPLTQPELTLHARGASIPVQVYVDWHHLAGAKREPVELIWTLRPSCPAPKYPCSL